MTALHLIAVNCHEFHDKADVIAGLESLEAAVAQFRHQRADPILVRVYWHNRQSPPQALRSVTEEMGFELRHLEPSSNGENLNRQIDDAISDGAEIFFRVDGDDTVSPLRFVVQSDLLTSGNCDLCGGGLHYMPPEGPGYVMLPAVTPGPRDFIENQFVLHPSMGIRLDAFRRAGLRYWSRRLEDKALLLQAWNAGLRIRNLQTVMGAYNIDPGARNLLTQKWLNLRLNLQFLIATRSFRFVPYAVLLFGLHVAIGSDRLRRVRYVLHARQSRRAGPPRKTRNPVTS